jgi:hypothetical protein
VARSAIEHLQRGEPPWTVTWPASRDEAHELARALQAKGVVARVLRGWKMGSWDGSYSEIGAALQFPPYFGENLNALHDCLTDLSWLPGPAYAVIVADAHLLLRGAQPDSLGAFLDHIRLAGERWAEPRDPDKPWGHREVPFHAVLQVPAAEVRRFGERLARAGHKPPRVDFDLNG